MSSTINAFKPSRLEIDVNSDTAAKSWKHWKKTFENYTIEHEAQVNSTAFNKLRLLTNFVSAEIFEFIEDCTTYEAAVEILQDLFVKKPNEIFARHLLATRKQQNGESLQEFMQALQILSKNCQCKDISGEQYRKELCRDALINGILSPIIRQRLLENSTLDLKTAFDQANALDTAHRNSLAYNLPTTIAAAETCEPLVTIPKENSETSATNMVHSQNFVATSNRKKCYFCGYNYHERKYCPARNSSCNKCGKLGHFMKVCKSKTGHQVSATLTPDLRVCALCPYSLSAATLSVCINGRKLCALVDSGSSDNYISNKTIQSLCLDVSPTQQTVSMAQSKLSCTISGFCVADVAINNQTYTAVTFGVMDHLCADIILGQTFQKQHKRLVIEYDGCLEDFVISKSSSCALPAALVPTETLFPNLPRNCKPIAVKSRQYNEADRNFIAGEIKKLLEDDIIETSRSPWRAQIVVVRTGEKTHRKYTAFEANGKLWQYKRIPFGVTNGGMNFQRAINRIIEEENLKDVYAYQDDVTVCGRNQDEHDLNVKKFLKAFKRRNLSFNETKTVKSAPHINVLGYRVQHKLIQPDPERLKPLQEFPPPQNKIGLQRVLGMLAYYAKWIPKFSDKVKPLATADSFPLNDEACQAFSNLKGELMNASLQSIDETLPFVVECDASDVAVSATLNQGGRPVAFLSRMLHGAELLYPAVEKEATAIIEATRKWRDLLLRRHFELITDQRSVAFMLDNRRRTKIKNNKIQTWRMELASLSYTIHFRPGKLNVGADSFTRAYSASVNQNCQINDIHDMLCHPGVTRLLHFVRTKNLPFSTEEVRKACLNCRVCQECKPQFYKMPQMNLIKATKPMERVSIDFKGPLPSKGKNKYILTIIDEYSRFPFAIPCPNMHSSTVVESLKLLFVLVGLPNYIHSDRGSSFLSKELQSYLHGLGIATSSCTPYHPTGNAQVERYNGIIWKAVTLALKSRGMNVSEWEQVLPGALHSIRSLLCTSTNATPHERFFAFNRRSENGTALPSWLVGPGKVFLRRFVRSSKHEPLVDEVDLVNTNPTYARVRYQDGRESTVSLKDLAPCRPHEIEKEQPVTATPQIQDTQNISNKPEQSAEVPLTSAEQMAIEPAEAEIRRSARSNKGVPPIRYVAEP
ncbi:unnamed protein product [Clavelina lepadiformis]|uniref:Reverse transcriptase n=1 Tax=Clavelina lepadiformis TaxID=159417 RepID=A0ABP0H2Q3_CLALP